jgi:hypothetical protein
MLRDRVVRGLGNWAGDPVATLKRIPRAKPRWLKVLDQHSA